MAYEQRDMDGSLFPNNKRQSDRSPDMTGKCMIEGVLYYMNAWHKPNDRISVSFKPVGADAAPAGNAAGSYQQSAGRPPLRPGGFGAGARPGGGHLPDVGGDDDARLL